METIETKNKDKAAFPSTDGRTFATEGLTKREYFAGLALQGILANRELQLALYKDIPVDREIFPTINNYNCLAVHAIDKADWLLKQLELQKA